MRRVLAILAAGVILAPTGSSAEPAKAGKAVGQASSSAKEGTKAGASTSADQGSASVTSTQKVVGRKILKFDALKIEGEHETPDVIIIQEWTPPRDQVIEDKATDDLDRVFTGIRSLNRGFAHELSATPDSEAISAESKARSEEQKLYQREKPKTAERDRKTSLR